ncbi:MAG: hypothetical protein H6568_16515 [Lewinellaceae bacterium]|nr:hypothetical protein [Saprospiraceae bacterium]MCB9314359.1 hypothetical protein [Lewinellaceae bacterium]HRW75614.1 hypothetical protein [Saprospiraceae bacterium]
MSNVLKILLAVIIGGLGIYGLMPPEAVSVCMTVCKDDGTSTQNDVTISSNGNPLWTLTAGTPDDITLEEGNTYQISSKGFRYVELKTRSIGRLDTLKVTLFSSPMRNQNTISGVCTSVTSDQITVRSGTNTKRVTSGTMYTVKRNNTNGISQLWFAGENQRSVELGIETQDDNDRAKIDVVFDDSSKRRFLRPGFFRAWFSTWLN